MPGPTWQEQAEANTYERGEMIIITIARDKFKNNRMWIITKNITFHSK